jgi:hypothetical protein
MTLGGRRGYVLPLNLPLAGGDVLRYASAEVLDVRGRGGEHRLVLSGAAGGGGREGGRLVTVAARATLDGRRLAARRVGRRLRVRFATTGSPQTLIVR